MASQVQKLLGANLAHSSLTLRRCCLAGIVGSGICRRFLEEGAVVVAPLRSEARRADVEEELQGVTLLHGQLDTPILDYSTAAGADALAQYVRERHGGHIDIVVASLGGGFKMGTLSALSSTDFHDALGRALPHMLLAQSLFPLLKEQASSCFIAVTGMLGEVCSMPNAAALSIANAAIYGVVRALEAERREAPQRVVEVRLTTRACVAHLVWHPRPHARPASLAAAHRGADSQEQQAGPPLHHRWHRLPGQLYR